MTASRSDLDHAHRLLALADTTEDQVVAQRLLGEALIRAGELRTAKAALRGALTFAVDLPDDHPDVTRVRELLDRL